MEISLTILLTLWVLLLLGLLVVVVIAIVMPNVFKYDKSLNHAEKRKAKREFMIGTSKENKYNSFFRISLYSGLLALILMWVSLFVLIAKHYVLTLWILGVVSGLYTFLGVIIPNFQYQYLIGHPSDKISVISQEQFSRVLLVRKLRSIFMVLLCLLPAIFSAQALQILIDIILYTANN